MSKSIELDSTTGALSASMDSGTPKPVTKPKTDRTFDPLSEYGSHAWCAAVLGKSTDWFRKNREELEAVGFPRVCRIVGQTIKADVRAWITKRRQYSDEAAKVRPAPKREDRTRYDLL